MKKITLTLLLFLIVIITKSQSCENGNESCDTTFKKYDDISNNSSNQYNKSKVRYISHLDNYPRYGKQTWYYEIYSGTPAISHIIFNFPKCLKIERFGTCLSLDSSSFTTKTLGLYKNLNPPTNEPGYKYDSGITSGNTVKFFLTVDKVYYIDDIDITIKASTKHQTEDFCGPNDECEALPIKLLSYSIIENKESDVLIWETATEIDIEYYEVKLISEDTNTIDRIFTSGDSYNIKTYMNTYNKPDISKYYYQINAVNYDGEIDNSFFLLTKFKKEILNVSPNPSHNYINIPNKIGSNVSIYDLGGKLIFNTMITSGDIKFNIEPGVYFLYCDNLHTKLIIF